MAKNGKASKSRKPRKTKDKGDEPEMRKGGPELLIELKSDDFKMHFGNVKRAKEAMGKAKSGYDAQCKACKKVSPQLLDAVKKALAIEGKDMDDVKAELEVFGFVLRETAHPIQLSIHDTLLGDVLTVAYGRGKEAGGNGKPCASPYPAGSDLDDEWKAGWRNAVGGNLGLSEQETEEAVSDAPSEREREAAE